MYFVYISVVDMYFRLLLRQYYMSNMYRVFKTLMIDNMFHKV